MRAQATPLKRNTSWAGRFMSMMHMITGQGSRDDAATVHDFVEQFGFDSTANRILPVPNGVLWAAWEKFVQIEPWENVESNSRTTPTARIRLVTYKSWFDVPQGTAETQKKGYPTGMLNYNQAFWWDSHQSPAGDLFAVSVVGCLLGYSSCLVVWIPLFLDPSDGVFGRFDLAALCGCRTLNFCLFVCSLFSS